MKIYKHITIALTLTFLALCGLAMRGNFWFGSAEIPSVQAQTGSFSGSGEEAVCRNGARDWNAFISATLSYDDFVEYWKDLIGVPPKFVNSRYSANYCLFLDVDNLLKQVEKVREQIRKAFYVCDGQIDKLKKTYYRLEAELFFARKYINVNDGKIITKPDATLLKEMKDYFILDKGFLSEDELKALFTQLKTKYESKSKAYAECKDPTWDNLLTKFEELKNHITGGFGIKESAEKTASTFNKAINAQSERTGNFLWGLLDVKINEVSPRLALSDIMAELKKNAPDGYSFDQLKVAQDSDVSRYDNAINQATYEAQYEHLYKATSADALANVTDRLKYLEGTIRGTYPFINQTSQCTQGILKKAC